MLVYSSKDLLSSHWLLECQVAMVGWGGRSSIDFPTSSSHSRGESFKFITVQAYTPMMRRISFHWRRKENTHQADTCQDILSGCPSHHKPLHQSPSLTWAAWPQGICTLKHKPKSFSVERDLSISSYTQPFMDFFIKQIPIKSQNVSLCQALSIGNNDSLVTKIMKLSLISWNP